MNYCALNQNKKKNKKLKSAIAIKKNYFLTFYFNNKTAFVCFPTNE